MVVQAPVRKLWLFVPLIYFMQAVPVTIVQEVSVVLFKDMGIGNVAITRWTSLLALPWTMKLLWGPLVDVNFSKRAWVVATQGLITLVLAVFPFLLRLPNAFTISVITLAIAAILSSTCDIATDGFYLLTLTREEQSLYVGIQSMCYKLGRLFCIGFLVFLAGALHQQSGWDKMAAWNLVLLGGIGVYGLGWVNLGLLRSPISLPRPPEDAPREKTEPNENWRNLLRTLCIVAFAVLAYFTLNSVVRLLAHAAWLFFGGTKSLKGWHLTPDQVTAELIQLPLCLVSAALSFWAARALLRGTQMASAWSTFFRQQGIVAILAFILLFRFGEAMVSKMAPLFLKDAVAVGGLGLSNLQVGPIIGVAGVVGIIIGGILGGAVLSRWGLRQCFWPLAICMHLPNLLYLWAAIVHPAVAAIYLVSFVDQFGYGFGFAAYSVYLMTVAQRGVFRTSHYGFGTGLGAACIMVAGILSGIVQNQWGYVGFFIFVAFATIPGMLTLLFIPMENAT